MDTMTTMKKWEDEYFTVAKKVQEPVVHYTGRMAETVAEYVPERPTFMAGMPTMHQLVDNGLKFRKRMVDEQATFVRRMLIAMGPMTTKFEATKPTPKPAPKATAKPTPKPTAKTAVKTAARRVVRAA
jgi:hypothetical protein